jgi:hypothetical protein
VNEKIGFLIMFHVDQSHEPKTSILHHFAREERSALRASLRQAFPQLNESVILSVSVVVAAFDSYIDSEILLDVIECIPECIRHVSIFTIFDDFRQLGFQRFKIFKLILLNSFFSILNQFEGYFFSEDPF